MLHTQYPVQNLVISTHIIYHTTGHSDTFSIALAPCFGTLDLMGNTKRRCSRPYCSHEAFKSLFHAYTPFF